MRRKRQSHVVRIYVKERKYWPTEEHVGFSSAFKIVDCLTGQELKSKSGVFYVLDTTVFDPVSFFLRMIQKGWYEPYVKISIH